MNSCHRMCQKVVIIPKMFNLLTIAALVSTLTSVSANTTANTAVFGERISKTTTSLDINSTGDQITTDLATDSTNWVHSMQTLSTQRPTLFDTQKTTINGFDTYSKTETIHNEKVTQSAETSITGKAVTLTSPAMAAVFEETRPEGSDGSVDGMQSHESVTTKSLLTKHSDNSIFMGNKGSNYEHICDFCLYEGQGNFTSYGYPLHYRNGLNCTYRVMRIDDKSDVCEVELYFHDFDIPLTSQHSMDFLSSKSDDPIDCTEDYLEVNGHKYCGQQWKHRSDLIAFPQNQRELVFRFISDGKTNGRGFWAEVKRRPNSCFGTRLKTQASEVCQEKFSALEFEILSPDFPDNYPLNADCMYEVKRVGPDVCALELMFYKFDVESSQDCAYDYLQIDGQKFCGTLPDTTYQIFKFEEEVKSISFQSDSQVSKSGFHIHVKQVTDCRTPSLPAPPSCNVCTSEGFGALVSYSYPDYYRNNLFCTYTIDRRNADYCYVELQFEDFELQKSNNCEADYLQVEDQRFCGEALKKTKRVIPFEGKDKGVVLLFRTDASKTKRGFLIQYKQLECTNDVVQEKASLPHSAVLPVPNSRCDYVYSDKEFVIKSENFSKSYANNLECSYYVKRNSSKVCYLELTFVKFDVEASPECQYDYLEVGNTVRLCGTLQTETVRTYIFDANEKLLKFHSDASNNRNGYLIKAEQLECKGDKIIRKNAPAVTTSAASVISPTHYSVGDNSLCSQVISESETTIYSPNYPEAYPADQDCLNMVRKVSDSICKLEVTFDDFEIQPSDPNSYCKYDFLDFNGVRVCGDVQRGDIRTYSFPSETFPIHFHSDNSVTSSDRAFRIYVRQIDCQTQSQQQLIPTDESRHKDHFQQPSDCNRVYSESAFDLKSPYFPNNYPNNVNCKYTILKQRTSAKICHLEVNFVDMHLEKSEDCSHDYLNFNGQLMCGSLSTETTRLFPFESNQFVINFVSDHYRSQRGFYLKIRQRECPQEDHDHVVPPDNGLTQCGGVYGEEIVNLKSPHYPHYYDNNIDCVFIIKRRNDNICRLDLRFLDFDVEPSPGCVYDYLMIEGKKLCGDLKANRTRSLDFHETEKTILFRSETQSNRRGFWIRAYQTECDPYPRPIPSPPPSSTSLGPIPPICEICFTEVIGHIQSYDYPNSYPANLNCKYKITALPGNCMVQLNFDQFNLEFSERCDKDYLEINNIRYCGNQLEGATLLAFNKKPEEVLIRFVTNGHKSSRGFRASYTQLPCIGGVPSGPQQIALQAQQQRYGSQTDYQFQPQPQRPPQKTIDSPQVSNYGSVPIAIVDNHNAINGSVRRLPCDRVIYDMVFEIKSPNYPNYYPPNHDCLYSIRRINSNICKLRLNFVYFDLKGEYKECSGDSLEMDGSKVCGRLPNNTIREIPFDSYKLSLRFRSDSDINSKGFDILGEQMDCSYELKSSSSKSSAHHPKPQYHNHQHSESSVQYSNDDRLSPSQSHAIPQPQPGQSYPDYQSAPYTPQSTESVRGRPQHHSSYPSQSFQTHSNSHSRHGQSKPSQPSSYERGGSVGSTSFSDKRYPIQQSTTTYVGQSQYQYSEQQRQRPFSPSQRLQSNRHQYSDKYEQSYDRPDSGYNDQSNYQQNDSQRPAIDRKPKPQTNPNANQNRCDEKIDKMYFEIKSPKELSSECMYRIEKARDNVCQLDILFSNFDLGDQSCDNQYMAVNGQRLCGTIDKNTMKTFKFDGNQVMIEVRADTMGFGKGFDLKARQVECGPPNGSTGRPPEQVVSNYDNDNDLYRPTKDTQSGYGSSPKEPSHQFRPIPRPHQPSPTIRGTPSYSVRPTQPNRRFGANSDGFSVQSSNEFDGQQKKLDSMNERCHLIYRETEFTIKSPNYPKPYPPDMLCRYTVRKATPNVCAIDMRFDLFNIDDDFKCAKDYLEVDQGRICGPLPPSHERRYYFLPEEQEKVIIFRSDDSGTKSGFSLLVRQIEDCSMPWQPMSAPTPPTVCDVCHHSLRGQITSSNYPSHYTDFMRCSYRVQAMGPDYCQVKLYLRDIDIEASPSGRCMKDALIIDSEKYCGRDAQNKEMTLTFPSSEPREVVINFQSDISGNGRGFLIEFVQEMCSPSANRRPSLPQPMRPIATVAVSPLPSDVMPTKPDNRFGTLIPPIYPPNYVSRAHIEEIVQTQVQVLDKNNDTQQTQNKIPLIS